MDSSIKDKASRRDSYIKDNQCMICVKNTITYCCMPCRCEILCKICAMKMATGGKCRKCKEFFTECKRIA